MRIGIEAQRIFRKKKHGMDIYALELIKALQQWDKHNEYYIFVKPGPDVCLKESSNFKLVMIKGITYADWEQISLPMVSRKYDLDLLHCTSNTAPVWCSTPIILTLHDIIYLKEGLRGGSIYQQLGHLYRRFIVPRVFKKAAKVLTVSKFEANVIEEYFEKAKEVKAIYNGINRGFNNRSKSDSCSVLNITKQEYLLFLGNTAPKKNMLGVIKAYCQYIRLDPEALPLVILETSKDYIAQLLRKNHLPIETINHIYCPGYISHDQLPLLYSGAKVFLYPSLRESFGIPIIESMSCGTPVITSSTSSMPEVGKSAASYVNPRNTNEMAHTLLNLVKSTSKLRLMSRLGLERAKAFSWTSTSQKTHEIYLESIPKS
ncbi:MAG: glycosyltransferase family 4 protein [Cyclobacteriaceae bacterium]|nr:glycosyltransferase family 4 protein [Cyclobacteriaceae bacterium HetDA_MAG_MS6]